MDDEERLQVSDALHDLMFAGRMALLLDLDHDRKVIPAVTDSVRGLWRATIREYDSEKFQVDNEKGVMYHLDTRFSSPDQAAAAVRQVIERLKNEDASAGANG